RIGCAIRLHGAAVGHQREAGHEQETNPVGACVGGFVPRTASGRALAGGVSCTPGVALAQEKVALGHDGPSDRARFAERHKSAVDPLRPSPSLAKCDIRLPRSSRTPFPGTPFGAPPGGSPSPSPPTIR